MDNMFTCSQQTHRKSADQRGGKQALGKGGGGFCVTVETDWRYDTLCSSMTSGWGGQAGGKTGDL